MKVILVGELNPYGQDPRYALYHEPEHASGARLRRILGLRITTYVGLTKRNLCIGRWSMKAAQAAARQILKEDWDCVVMLGAKVKAAFGVKLDAFSGQGVLVALPHPSGRNPAWNYINAAHEARELMKRMAPGIPWGEEPGAA